MTIIILSAIIVALTICIIVLFIEIDGKNYLLREHKDIATDAKNGRYVFAQRSAKLEAEIDRLNKNQNGYRHPVTGVFCTKNEYYAAVLGGRS